MEWNENDCLLYGIWNKLKKIKLPLKIASFDLDNTIIYKNKNDVKNFNFKVIDNNIFTIFEKLIKKKYLIIIFTNQSGMSQNKNFKINIWKKKIESFFNLFFSKLNNFYFAIYIAKCYNLYRKPNIGMWKKMKLLIKKTYNINKLKISKYSFFCGDSAGRIEDSYYKKILYPKSKIKGDISDVDIKFSLNIGIKFIIPEEIYQNKKKIYQYKLSGFEPKKYININKNNSKKYIFIPRKKELLFMIGYPASGKTEFINKYILPYNYVNINLDNYKNKNLLLKKYEYYLKNNESIVIDSLNTSIKFRKIFIEIAQNYNYKHIRAIIINIDEKIAKHLNNLRHIYSKGKIPKINNIVYNIFKKLYQKPKKNEGFDIIEDINFIFDFNKLKDNKWKKIFLLYSE